MKLYQKLTSLLVAAVMAAVLMPASTSSGRRVKRRSIRSMTASQFAGDGGHYSNAPEGRVTAAFSPSENAR